MSGPRFSVVVTTYNRPGQLVKCLEALALSNYPREAWELVVVDDGGDEPLEPLVAQFASRMDVRCFRQRNAGPGAGRNLGARMARYEFLAFTDDDCTPTPDWLPILAESLAAQPDRLVGGRTINGLSGNIYSEASQWIVDITYMHYNFGEDSRGYFASNNMALRAGLFAAAGGFNESLWAAEDRELCNRWTHSGYRLQYEPRAVVVHFHSLTLGEFLRQHFSYGTGAAQYHAICSRRGSGRLSHHLAFHARLPVILARVGISPGQFPLIAAWQAANAAGFFWQIATRRARS